MKDYRRALYMKYIKEETANKQGANKQGALETTYYSTYFIFLVVYYVQ